MSKYQPLTERLLGRPEPEWRASFAEIEAVLGFALPKGARGGAGWWTNNGERPHVRAWTGVGWEVAEVDPEREAVVFRKPVSEAALQNPLAADEPVGAEVVAQPETSRDLEVARARRRWGLAAAITAGVAVTAGAGTLIVRGLLRRHRTPNS